MTWLLPTMDILEGITGTERYVGEPRGNTNGGRRKETDRAALREKLHSLKGQGLTQAQIASAAGCSRETVRAYLGLTRKSPRDR